MSEQPQPEAVTTVDTPKPEYGPFDVLQLMWNDTIEMEIYVSSVITLYKVPSDDILKTIGRIRAHIKGFDNYFKSTMPQKTTLNRKDRRQLERVHKKQSMTEAKDKSDDIVQQL